MKLSLKKTIAKMLCLTTCVCSMATPLIACKDPGDPVLILATDALDRVFNPFFYTSGPDGEIVSQTQIGMLSSNEKGELIADWNEPCVAHDWSIIKNGNPSMVQGNNYGDYYTDYYFALKDNIKFSDGTLLTKDDVLFNLYMYLDPAYTGSNTMYSVKIKGLTEYRTQTKDLNNAAESDAHFENKVKGRLQAILGWIEDEDALWGDAYFADYEYNPDNVTPTPKNIERDITRIQEYYNKSLQETWTSVTAVEIAKDETTGQSYIKEYEKYKDKDGKYIMTEPYQLFLYYNGTATLKEHFVGSGADTRVDYYEYDQSSYPGKIPANAKDRTSDKFRDQLIKYAYDGMFMEQKDATDGYKTNLFKAMNSYPVSMYIHDYLLSDVKYLEFKDNMQVENISGIEILSKQSTIDYKENESDTERKQKTLKDKAGNPKEYDVLHIRINGIDPKAKQNFAFTVAPGHYYSSQEEWSKAINDDNKDNKFFGVKFSDPAFMEMVQAKQLPLGAGPFLAAKSTGGKAQTKSDFLGSNNIVNFEANPNFMLGAPKIKKLRYKVISSSQLYNAVKTGDVDYASPSMKRDDINKLEGDSDKIDSEKAENLGYGYIGISARYIPNIYIRKAIMTTLNAQSCIDSYYGTDGGSVIYRPMSKTLVDYYDVDKSWESTFPYKFDKTGAEAKRWLELGGCDQFSNGVRLDENGKPIKYTFTIAGDSDDHPANRLLTQSMEILKGLGCDITVVHDSNALIKLATGQLTVWAAAWSSSSDPDMYQVYHKNSQATSTTAWGYKYVLSSEFTEEKVNPNNYDQVQIITELSNLIDEGRETDVVENRVDVYNRALDKLMDLAVEFPTYQRKVYYIWRKGVFKNDTIFRGTSVTSYQSPLSRIWEVEITK